MTKKYFFRCKRNVALIGQNERWKFVQQYAGQMVIYLPNSSSKDFRKLIVRYFQLYNSLTMGLCQVFTLFKATKFCISYLEAKWMQYWSPNSVWQSEEWLSTKKSLWLFITSFEGTCEDCITMMFFF